MRKVTAATATIADLAAVCPPEAFPRYRHLLDLPGVADAFRGEDGEIVCVGGISLANGCCGEAWNVPGPRMGEYLAAPRAIADRLAHHARSLGLRRVQSTVLETDLASLRFDHWLGFVDEAVLEDFGPAGEAAIIMRWRKTW